MYSKARTVEEYLDELPEDRREVIARLREAVLAALPEGYVESMNWGMITYEIPLERYPDTYNRQPLGLAAIAAQKNHYALYLMCAYQDPEQAEALRRGFAEAGKKLDMGKSCLRFRRLEDLPIDVVTGLIRSTPPEKLIATYENSRARAGRRC